MSALAMMLQAGVSSCLATALAAYVGLLRRKSGPEWSLLAILIGIAVWTAGVVLAWAAPESQRSLDLAIVAAFLGSCFVPGLTFHLSARLARIAIFEEHPAATLAAALTPGLLSFLLLLTNPAHGLFLASPGFEVFAGSAREWAAPLFWVHLSISYAFTATAIGVSSHRAVRAGPSLERRRLTLLALSSLAPLGANALYVFELLPISVPLTYLALGVTGLLLVLAIARYGLIASFVPASDVIAHLRAGILLADPSGRVVGANESAEDLLGCSASGLLGRSLAESVSPVDPEGILRRRLADATQGEPVLASLETPAGRILEVHGGCVPARAGAVGGRFLVLDDHTEQRLYERSRQRIERLDAIGALVGGLSHEINNPLAFVQASISHIVRTAGELEGEQRSPCIANDALGEIREVAEEAYAGLQRIQEIVASTKQLLGDPRPRRECVDLNEVARQAVAVSGLNRSCAFSIELHLHPDPPPVPGSAVQLGQIALNLLLNARDALEGRPSGSILVGTRPCGSCGRCAQGVELHVEDSGNGVPEDLRDRIFAPFFTTKEPGRGTGLGLAVCAEIARRHGGTIEVSESLLGGACFALRLPCGDRECTPAWPAPLQIDE